MENKNDERMLNMNNQGRKVLNGFIWRFAERCGAQLVSFIVSIILARLLEPSDYGIVSIMLVFISILQVFVDSGLGNALIQKKDADDLDFSTVFYMNILFCSILYAGVFVFAPMISRFYKISEMTSMIRVLGLTVLISGVKNVQQAYVSRHMLFKKFFYSTLGGTIAAAVAGILMAYTGYGVWALIVQQVVNIALDTIILWITVQWRPKGIFSFERLKELFSYGWKLLASGIVSSIYDNLRSLIIGRVYSSADLAYYNQGKKFPNYIIANINTSIESVLLPAMSDNQEDSNHVKNMTRRSIKTATYIMAPLMIGLVFVAEYVIELVLTDKWLPSVFYLRIFCITYLFYPIHTANLNAIKAMGRSDLFLKQEILKTIVGLLAVIITARISVKAMAYSLLVTSVISQVINSWPNKRLLNYQYTDQLKDILPGIALAVFMGCCIYPMSFLSIPAVTMLIIQVIVGAVIYVAGSIIFKLDSFQYLWSIIKPLFERKRGA